LNARALADSGSGLFSFGDSGSEFGSFPAVFIHHSDPSGTADDSDRITKSQQGREATQDRSQPPNRRVAVQQHERHANQNRAVHKEAQGPPQQPPSQEQIWDVAVMQLTRTAVQQEHGQRQEQKIDGQWMNEGHVLLLLQRSAAARVLLDKDYLS